MTIIPKLASRLKGKGKMPSYHPTAALPKTLLDLLYQGLNKVPGHATHAGKDRTERRNEFYHGLLSALWKKGGSGYISDNYIKRIEGAQQDPRTRSAQVQAFIMALGIQVVAEVRPWVERNVNGKPRRFTIPRSLLIKTAEDPCYTSYAKWDNGKQRKLKHRQFPKSEWKRILKAQATPRLLAVLQHLSAKPVYFDKKAALSDIYRAMTDLESLLKTLPKWDPRWQGANDRLITLQKLWRHAMQVPSGPIYTTYRPAASGRVQASKYPLQGVKKELRPYFRSVRHPDWPVYSLDYKTFEIWLAQYLSKDPRLLVDLQSGDIYKVNQGLLGDSISRNQAKALLNAVLNGAGKRTVSTNLYGWDNDFHEPGGEKAAQAHLEALKGRYKGLTTFLNDTTLKIVDAGYAETWDGIKRRDLRSNNDWKTIRQSESEGKKVPAKLAAPVTPYLVRKTGISHEIQGLGAAIMRMVLLLTHNRRGCEHFEVLMPIHDSLLVAIDPEHLDEVLKHLTKVMERIAPRAVGLRLRLTVKPELLNRIGSVHGFPVAHAGYEDSDAGQTGHTSRKGAPSSTEARPDPGGRQGRYRRTLSAPLESRWNS